MRKQKYAFDLYDKLEFIYRLVPLLLHCASFLLS